MRRASKYRLYPPKKQEQQLFWTLTRCRELYHAALAERKEAYRVAGKSITYRMQAKINILRLGRSLQVPHLRASGGSLVQAPAL